MRTLWLLGCLCVLLSASITWYLRPLKPSIIRLQMSLTKRAFLAVLLSWQADGVARFRKHFVLDYPYLACYGLLGFQLATRLGWLVYAPLPLWLSEVLPWILPMAALLDAVENALHIYLTRGQRALYAAPGTFVVTGVVCALKWLLIACFLAVAAYAWFRR